jgi:hypothetical protein
LLHKLASDASNRGEADLKRFDNLLVGPTWTTFADISFKQDMGMGQRARRYSACRHGLEQGRTLGLRQLDPILFRHLVLLGGFRPEDKRADPTSQIRYDEPLST